MAGITIRGLSKRFGAGEADVAAVDDLDLDIKDNSFVTLLGPSGCGKTTTLRLIAGYIVPDKGTIEIDGRVLSSPGAVIPPEARGMGMVFQNYAVWPHKTVFENVAFGLKLRKIPTTAVRQKVADIHHESAGDRQRGDPGAVLPLHFQPAGHVLAEQCQAAEIGVRRDAELLLPGAILLVTRAHLLVAERLQLRDGVFDGHCVS